MSLDKRLQQALVILLQPENFKICEGCDSVVTLKTVICPGCKAYRFNGNIEDIITHTEMLAERQQQTVTDEDLFG